MRFLATGCFQREDGDLHNVSQASVSRCVHKVLTSIASLKDRFIYFPTNDELRQLEIEFFQKSGFPGVIGAIDCTHVPIVSPGGNDAELFRNRKGWFSINVQIMCDSKMIIRNIVASWQGSTHDSRIFNESTLREKLLTLPARNHILGDQGYPCMQYLLTPLQNPQTAAERRYNFVHSSTRMVIERVNGVLKRRFPCLGTLLRFTPHKSCVTITACAVLHNFAYNNADEEIDGENIQNFDQMDRANQGHAHGFVKRRAIVTDFFS